MVQLKSFLTSALDSGKQTLSRLFHFTPRADLDVVDIRKEFSPIVIRTPDHHAHRLLPKSHQITQADSGVHQASTQLQPAASSLKKKRNARETDQSPTVTR